jgi:predicted transcriptional regulator
MVSLQSAECEEMKKSSDPRGDIHKDGILKFINDNSSMRFSRKVNEIVRHTRLSRQTVNEHLNKLAADNKLVKTGRGEYVPRELFDCFCENNLPMRVSKPYLLGYLTTSLILNQKNVR